MFKSICFTICFISLWLGIILQKKSSQKERLIVWIPMSFFMILTYHALMAGIFKWLQIPIGMISILFIDIFLSALIWLQIFRKKAIQSFEFKAIDWIAALTFLVIAILGGLNQFGYKMDINYLTTDPGAHYRQALTVLETHNISRMYFAPLNNALFLELFEFILRPTRLYRAFIFADILMYFMSGFMIYGIMREKAKNRYTQVTAVLLAAIYMLGYPRNNLVFGFVYLGIGISICTLLVFLTNKFIELNRFRNWLTFYLMCGAVSIGICYSLYAPVVFFAICLVLTMTLWKEKRGELRLACKSILFRNLIVFLLPCCIILSSGVFALGSFASEVGSGIALEGFVYRELYSNFLLLLPFAFYGVWRVCQNKKGWADSSIAIFSLALMFTIGLGVLGVYGLVSSYYFYKMHYLISMFLFYLCFVGVTELIIHAKALVTITGILSGILAVVCFADLESVMQEKAPNFVPEQKSSYFFHVYKFNRDSLKQMVRYSAEKIQLYEMFYDQFDEGENYIFNGRQEDYSWACGIAQRLNYDKNTCWTMFSDYEIEQLTKPGSKPAFSGEDGALFEAAIQGDDMLPIYLKYSDQKPTDGTWIIVMNSQVGNSDWKELPYADNLDVAYENAAGCIAKLRGIEAFSTNSN